MILLPSFMYTHLDRGIPCSYSAYECTGRAVRVMLVRVLSLVTMSYLCNIAVTPRNQQLSICVSSLLLVWLFFSDFIIFLVTFVKVTLSLSFFTVSPHLPEQLPRHLLGLLHPPKSRPACYIRGSKACLGQNQVL